MPTLPTGVERFKLFGEFTVSSGVMGFGDWALQLDTPVRAGRWRVMCAYEEETGDELLLIHSARAIPKGRDPGPLRELGRIPIATRAIANLPGEVACFTAADASLREALTGHLEFVQEMIGDVGVRIMLEDDDNEYGVIYVEDGPAPELLYVNFLWATAAQRVDSSH